MRRRHTNAIISPGDGLLILHGKGAWVNFTEEITAKMMQLQRKMRELRGVILAASFAIENELVLLALADEFGTTHFPTVSSSYIQREQEWREERSLERKIKRVKPIIRKREDAYEADKLLMELAEYRELRNLMAHYPSWLEPDNDKIQRKTIGLKLLIADRTHVWDVDDTQVVAWINLINSLYRSLEKVRLEMTEVPSQASSPPGFPCPDPRHFLDEV